MIQEIEINEHTRIEDVIGKNFHQLNYQTRLRFTEQLTSDELLAVQRNIHVTPELLEKGQGIIDSLYFEKCPTPEMRMQKAQERWRTQEFERHSDELYQKTQRLKQLNQMVEEDRSVPVGERKKLRKDIEQHRTTLSDLGIDADAVILKNDFLNSTPIDEQVALKLNSPAEYERLMSVQAEKTSEQSDAVKKAVEDIGFNVDSFLDSMNR